MFVFVFAVLILLTLVAAVIVDSRVSGDWW